MEAFNSQNICSTGAIGKNLSIENGKPAVGAKRNGKPTYALNGADNKTFSTDWLTDRAIDYITDPKATKPFFTVISYPDPHGPNTIRPPYDHRFDKLPFVAPTNLSKRCPRAQMVGRREEPSHISRRRYVPILRHGAVPR